MCVSTAETGWSFIDKDDSGKMSVWFRRAAGIVTLGVMLSPLFVREMTAVTTGVIIAAMIIAIVLNGLARMMEINREED